MRTRPLMLLCIACSLSLTFCNRQSAAQKAKADYQAKEKALDQQLEQNSKNYNQRLKKLEQQSGCGPWAPGMPAPKTPQDCAKLNAQWQRDQSTGWSLPSIPPKASPPKKHK